MIFPQKYAPIFDFENLKKNNIRYIILYGGRASGKSTVASHWLHDLSFTGSHVILLTRFQMASADISVLPEFDKTLELRNSVNFFKRKYNLIENIFSKAKIIFKGLKANDSQATARLKSITDLNVWILDEAEELDDEGIFDDIDFSIRRKDYLNVIVLILNTYRITKDHFIYQKFFKNRGLPDLFTGFVEDTLYIHSDYRDNYVNLSQSFIKIIEKTEKKNPEKYKYKFIGHFRSRAEGVIFNNWKIGEFDNDLPYLYGMDFGVYDPDVLIRVAFNKKLEKIYVELLFYKSGNSTSDLINLLKKYIKNKSALIIADSAGKRQIKDIRQAGFNIKPAKKQQVVSSIKNLLNFEIIVKKGKESEPLINEFSNYVWLDKKGEIPIDDYNHAIDALRYVVDFLTIKKIL